jgi:hypothetical protein
MIKQGDKIRLVDTKGLWGYSWSRHVKKNKIYTVRYVKSSGGILLEEFVIGYQNERFGPGDEQGLMWHRFELVKSKKKVAKKPVKKLRTLPVSQPRHRR